MSVGQYQVEVELDLRHRAREFHVALWEFANESNAAALARMRELTVPDAGAAPAVVSGAPARALTVDGQPAASVVIPADPTEQEQTAAQELVEAVYHMSGALISVRKEVELTAGHRVFIRRPRSAAKAGSPKSPPLAAAMRNAMLRPLPQLLQFLVRGVVLRQHRRPTVFRGDIGGNRRHLHPKAAQLCRRLVQRFGPARVDHQINSRLGQCHGTATPQPLSLIHL